MLTLFVIASSDNSLLFLYVRQKLGWTLTKYSLFSSIINGVGVIGTLFWVYFIHKKLKCAENNLIMAGLAISINSSVLYALARNDWFIYVGKQYNYNTIRPYYKNICRRCSEMFWGGFHCHG